MMTTNDREMAIEDILDGYAGNDRLGHVRQLVSLGVSRCEAEGLLAEIEYDFGEMRQADWLDSI